MPKFYAVQKGRVPGIYRSWDDAKAQVSGFAGAVHKSFATEEEAKAFLRKARKKHVIELPLECARPETRRRLHSDPGKMIIYTDGSARSSIKHLGGGSFCEWFTMSFSLSVTASSTVFDCYGITCDVHDTSNPTMELMAFAETMRRLDYVLSHLPAIPQYICFAIDYIGVQGWMLKNWQTEHDYIQRMVDKSRRYMRRVRKKFGVRFVFVHVPGHAGILGNEIADKLAKQVEDQWTFTLDGSPVVDRR